MGMKKRVRTKEQLLKEIESLQKRVAELEKFEVKCSRIKEELDEERFKLKEFYENLQGYGRIIGRELLRTFQKSVSSEKEH